MLIFGRIAAAAARVTVPAVLPTATLATAALVTAALVAGVPTRTPPASGVDAPPVARAYRTPALPASIDVVGAVVAHGGATSGTIRVRVGATATQQVTTISPQFIVTVAGVRASDMVTLEVGGAGFKYTSLLGTYGKLVQQAGADRVLTLAESDAQRVSPFSTALQFFVARKLGGAPTSDGQIETAMRSVPGTDIVDAASALANLASGAIAAPAGYAHGYALLQDQEAYRAFLQEHWQVSSEAGVTLAAVPMAAITSDDTSRTIALVGAIANLQVPLLAPLVQVIERDAAGYLIHGYDYRHDSRFTGVLDANGALTLTPVGEIYEDNFGSSCASNGNFIQVRTQLVDESHRLLRRGDQTSLRLVLARYHSAALNCPEYPTLDYTYARIWASTDLARTSPIADGRRFSGLRSLPHFCAPPASPSALLACEYAPHRFDANGTGMALELGAKVDAAMAPTQPDGQSPFAWSVTAPNVMRVDGDTASTRYWMLDPGNGLVAGLVYVAEATIQGTPRSRAGYAPMIDGNVPGGYESLSPVGIWRESQAEQYLEPYAYNEDNASAVVRVTRSADGTSSRSLAWPHYPYFDYQQETRWTVTGGRLFDTRVRGNNGRVYRDCAIALSSGATQCVPATVRYFRPMARSGDVLYGIEEVYTNLSDFTLPLEPIRMVRPAYQAIYHP